jgi:5-methylcytosine-specific restriction endonuclease McrA
MARQPGRWQRRFVLFCRQDGCCFYCEQPMAMGSHRNDPLRATIDHLQPLSERGSRSMENEVAACFGCNNARGTMPWLVFFCLLRMRGANKGQREAA